MSPAKTDRTEPLVFATAAAPSSWWPFIALVLGAIGCYGLLAAHLILDATAAGAWALAWLALPTVFFAGSVAALLIASEMPVRERLAAIPAAFFGYSPWTRSRTPSAPPSREPA
jgi:hypothetical protein